MDRRQRKTREAIFKAFSELLESNKYEHITVQDIIDKADIGRSTFYAHFETKDMLLKEMCDDIFEHIFDDELCEYNEDGTGLQPKLAHILWHLNEFKSNVCGILASQSRELFLGYLKENLLVLFEMYLKEFKAEVPKEFLLNYLVGSFSQTIIWWAENKMNLAPETIAEYYMKVVETH